MKLLEKTENPPLRVEAVNDTGVDLTNVDLVRNWLFMGLSGADQDTLYRAYWEPIEKSLSDSINSFLFYYTKLKTGSAVSEDYYQIFKKTFILSAGNTEAIENLLNDIKDYADLYAKYRNGNFTDKKINAVLHDIKHTGKDIFTPLILKILKNWDTNLIPATDAHAMLKYLESYIVRRDILEIPTNSLGPALITFLGNSDNLSDFISCINKMPERQRMPDDAELHTQLQLRDFYHLGDSYYYLERIEKLLNPAFSLSDPTIEHILPETMHTTNFPKSGVSPENIDNYNWELDLGSIAQDIHDKYQHTLGNLTILPRGENSRMGDYRFKIKKNWANSSIGGFNYGYLYTPIRISQSLGNHTTWNESAILARCSEMVNYICKVWPHP